MPTTHMQGHHISFAVDIEEDGISNPKISAPLLGISAVQKIWGNFLPTYKAYYGTKKLCTQFTA